jgi:hypothetical protein
MANCPDPVCRFNGSTKYVQQPVECEPLPLRAGLTTKPMSNALRILSVLMLLRTGGISQPSVRTRHVVLLFDERTELPGLSILNADFLQTLRSGSADPVEIYTEEMDLSRFRSDTYFAHFRDYLRSKYAGKNIERR